MKKRYFLMGAWAVCVLCACHNHGHDHADGHGGEDHAHEAEMAAEEAHGGHEDHADEIILTEEKAQAAGCIRKPCSRDASGRLSARAGKSWPRREKRLRWWPPCRVW